MATIADATCPHCNEPILLVDKVEMVGGRTIAVDTAINGKEGYRFKDDGSIQMIMMAVPGIPEIFADLHKPHWLTCKKAKEWWTNETLTPIPL